MFQVILFSLLGGLFSLVGAVLLLKNKKTVNGLVMYATPFAAGVLLAAAFSDLLPEALHELDGRSVGVAALCGVLGFFLLERFLRFFHHHHDEDAKNRTSNTLIITGDTLHNALDGVAIGAAFLINPTTGIVAAIAVAAHEIPQEIGDFGLLLKNGMSKKRVLLVNILSALATTITAVLTYAFGSAESSIVAYLLAITAGFFIYIAASDIIPEIHDQASRTLKDSRPWLLLVGAAFVLIFSPIAHSYIEAGHEGDHGKNEDTSHSEKHTDFVVEDGQPVPTLSVEAQKSDSGLTLHISTENFTFTPEKEGSEAKLGEGHAHLYINGKKITRIYSEWVFVSQALLPEVYDEVTVSLSNNDHSEYHLADGTVIAASTKVTSEKHSDQEAEHAHEE